MPQEPNNQTPAADHPNRALIEEILQLMTLSSMEEDERTMWTVLLPSMEKAELEKFKALLEKEAVKMTDIYLQATQKNK
jgi:hypothetical protein